MPDSLHIVHAADIHLDSPLRGLDSLGNEDLAHDLRRATANAFANMIQWCLDNKPDAVVLAGDIYDGDLRDYATGRFFSEQLGRLRDADIPGFVVAGNHDAESVVTKSLRLPDTVHRFSTDEAQSVRLDDLGLAVHGQGFATKAVTRNLAVDYPVALPGMVNVGLLHTSVAGYEGHDSYAPCSLADLTSKGYEYFALGHVHKREVLDDGQHTVAFSGNIQGRHVKETGPKGFYSVRMEPGGRADLRFVECDVARWANEAVDVSGSEDWDGALELISRAVSDLSEAAEGRPLILRLTVTGETVAAPELNDTLRLTHETALLSQRLGVTVARVRSSARLPQREQRLPRHVVDRLRTIADQTDPAVLEGELRAVRNEARDELLKMGMEDDFDSSAALPEALEQLLARLGGTGR